MAIVLMLKNLPLKFVNALILRFPVVGRVLATLSPYFYFLARPLFCFIESVKVGSKHYDDLRLKVLGVKSIKLLNRVGYLFSLLLVWHFIILRWAGINFLPLDIALFIVSVIYAGMNGFIYCKIMRHPSRLIVRNSPISKVASIVAGVKAHLTVIKTGAGVIGIGLAYNEAHHMLYPEVQKTPIEKGAVLVGKVITDYTGYPSNPAAIDTAPFPSTKEGLESESFKLQKQTIQISHDERLLADQKARAVQRAQEIQRLLFEIKDK